jgi:hypothetical protein
MAIPAAQETRENLKGFLICLTVGALCFLRRWYELELLGNRGLDYFREAPSGRTLLAAILLASFISGLAFFAAWQFVKRWGNATTRKLADAVFLVLMIYALESARRFLSSADFKFASFVTPAVLGTQIALIVGIAMAWRGNRRIVLAARRVTLMMALLFPLILLNSLSARVMATPAAAFAARNPAPRLRDDAETRRLIWMVFDEFDQRIAFEDRPASLALPEFDRLRSESVTAARAAEIADWTMIALPSLLTGKPIVRFGLVDADDLLLYANGSDKGMSWRQSPSVFSQAREWGVNSALVGWYHPYCRILGDSLVDCFARTSGHAPPIVLRELRAEEYGLWRMTWNLFEVQWANITDFYRSLEDSQAARIRERYIQRREQQRFLEIRDHALSMAARPEIDLLFIHWPIPHPYGIYDRHRAQFSSKDSANYLDNLALADRTLGDLRKTLESSGLWPNTTLLVTSDHGFRPALWEGKIGWNSEMAALEKRETPRRVPLILKLAGQTQAAVFDQPISSLVTHDLTLAVLKGEIRTAADAMRWLGQSKFAQSPGK